MSGNPVTWQYHIWLSSCWNEFNETSEDDSYLQLSTNIIL